FIRISDDTDAEDVLRLLQEEWKLDLPKLVISVAGGGKNFFMHPKLKDLFRQGLLKAAKTTGAWIITGGTNTGVMRHVGEAVKGHTVMSRGAMLTDKTSQVHLIGIAPWGIVEHRSELIGEDVVTYHMTSSLEIQGSCMDNNHSHFLLVDDGTEGKYGGEIAFRARLQNCLSNKEISKNENSQQSKSNGIPVVLVVLEGGQNAIRTVLESVTRTPAVPVVIADGSGRAADILAYAYSLYKANEGFDMKHFPEVAEHEILKLRIEKAFPKSSEKEWFECYYNVLECVKKSQYITIFHMDDDGIDIDKSILKAILKAQSASPSYQLDLALTWNRADIARTEIFTKDQKWKMETLEDKMEDALINNRVEFVDLLLEKGVSMKKFLTTDRLNNLFEAVTRQGLPSRVVLEELIGKDKIDKGFKFLDVIEALWPHLWGTHQGDDNMCLVRKRIEDDPYEALLLWSVLSNMQQMALFMWERGEKNLARALIAGKVYKLMARLTLRDDAKADVTDELTANFEEFKRLSVAFLDQCFRTNKDRTKQLLIYNLKNWGGQSCLSLAYAIEHEEFMAHVSCQGVLTEIWTGYLRTSQNSSLKIVLGLLIPTTVLSLEFHQLPEKQENLGTDSPISSSDVPENGGNEGSEKGNIFSASKFDLNIVWREKEKGSLWRNLTWSETFIAFYHAPATKFWANVFDYMLFLALFSYVVLVRQDKIPSIGEIVLIIFVCTLCAEEIRQILQSEPPTLKNKFKAWASSYWNRLDGLAVVSFFIGLGLRLYPPTRDAGHVVYCFDVAMWIMRLMHFFYVSKYMGPYVVMIGRMTLDLMYFLLIMVVFFLAYGIPQQALLYPNEGPSWSMASQIFFRPYFQAHGELFLDAPDKIENTTTVFGTARKDSYGDTVVLFMTAIYLLVVNILLLNLLIAIFNNTYEKVQTNAKQIWMFERYYLVTEYKQRPVLVPPFIILNHVIYAIRFLYRCCFKKSCHRNGNQDAAYTVTSKTSRNSYDNSMKIFEERCVDEYLREKNALLRATQEEQIRVINDRYNQPELCF
ncbi:unnamed protein product, partial [Porites lobata]